MMTASPDYAITKPGMAHYLTRKRDKPLRTYGKPWTVTNSPRGGEPMPKRIRQLEENETARACTRSKNDPALDEAAVGSQGAARPRRPTGDGSKRATILGYFQPVPPPGQQAVQSREKAESKGHGSPSRSHTKRKTRLLRLRAPSSPLSDGPDSTTTDNDGNESRKRKLSAESDARGCNDEHKGTKRKRRLQETGDTLANQACLDLETVKTAKGKADYAAKVKRAPSIQTTLNISTQPAFAECRVCDTVWNPLYPDDVKYHSMRHAVVTRARRKAGGGI
ncbi:hypothetical protein RJ55_07206 [Drechmeria coniospora]|nr:hypothetical protein RJ55_07206 [Drechmeria coniospora]